MEENKLAIVSWSSGPDSTCLIIDLLACGYTVYANFYNFGHPQNRIEKQLIQNNTLYINKHFNNKLIVTEYDVKDLFRNIKPEWDQVPNGTYEELKENYGYTLPNRNGIFFNAIYGTAVTLSQTLDPDHVKIGLGVHTEDQVNHPDCHPDFYKALDAALKIGCSQVDNIELYMPYLDKEKYEILADCLNKCNVHKSMKFSELMQNTISCYQPADNGNSCGTCPSCRARKDAFKKLKVEDLTVYLS